MIKGERRVLGDVIRKKKEKIRRRGEKREKKGERKEEKERGERISLGNVNKYS